MDPRCDDENVAAACRGIRSQKREGPALCADTTAKMGGAEGEKAQSFMTAGTHSFTPGSLETPDTMPLHITNTPQINEEKDRMLRAMKQLKHGQAFPSLCDFSKPQFSCLQDESSDPILSNCHPSCNEIEQKQTPDKLQSILDMQRIIIIPERITLVKS